MILVRLWWFTASSPPSKCQTSTKLMAFGSKFPSQRHRWATEASISCRMQSNSVQHWNFSSSPAQRWKFINFLLLKSHKNWCASQIPDDLIKFSLLSFCLFIISLLNFTIKFSTLPGGTRVLQSIPLLTSILNLMFTSCYVFDNCWAFYVIWAEVRRRSHVV